MSILAVRRSGARGGFQNFWLDSKHTFSFGSYYDPNWMGYRNLRVINDDRIRGGSGFPEHPHKEAEIISIVLEGGLAHKDNAGGEGTIRPGEVQVISAGTGVTHSEFNAEEDAETRFLQIWLLPDEAKLGQAPAYDQRSFVDAPKNELVPLVSGQGVKGALAMRADATLYRGQLEAGTEVQHALAAGRGGWVQVIAGEVSVNGEVLGVGDGVALEGEVGLAALSDADVLVFDLA